MRRKSYVVVLVGVALGLALRVWAGPPAVCQPIEIGKQTSLRFGDGPFDKAPEVTLDQVVPETLRILASSEDALVHMETLRRAVVYVQKSQKEIDGLCAALKERIEKAGDAVPANRQGLLWFDLGYAQGALRQLGKKWTNSQETIVDCFRTAVSLRPEDGATYFGAALASWGQRPKMAHYEFLAKALKLADDPDGLLRRNLMVVGQRFWDARSYEDLIAKVEAKL